jgi:hypothetical protein
MKEGRIRYWTFWRSENPETSEEQGQMLAVSCLYRVREEGYSANPSIHSLWEA